MIIPRLTESVVDDRPAIQEAIDYAHTLQQNSSVAYRGATYSIPSVFLPRRKYKLSSIPGRRHALELPTNVGLVGETGTMLTPVDDEIETQSMILCGSFKNFVKDITFARGYSALTLCGESEYYGQFSAAVGVARNVSSGCEFYGQLGPSIMLNPDTPSSNRSIQAGWLVSNFRFFGPHLYWGVADTMRFQSGVVEWDQWNIPPQLSEDGLPLGCWNTNGHLFVDNVMFAPNGVGQSAVVNQRSCWFVGTGEISVSHVTQFDLSFSLVRQRATDNGFRGNWGAPILIPGGDDPSQRMQLKLYDNYHNFSNRNLLEVYDYWPSELIIENNNDVPFEGCYGAFVHSRVPLLSLVKQHDTNQVVRVRQRRDPRGFRVRRGDEVDWNRESGGTIQDVSHVLWAHRDVDVSSVEPIAQPNTFTAGIVDWLPTMVTVGGPAGPDETILGDTVKTLVSTTDNHMMAFQSADIGTGRPAGIYTFSTYMRFATENEIRVTFSVQVDGDGPYHLAGRSVVGSAHHQRVSFSFYHPGPTHVVRVGCNAYFIPTGASASFCRFMLNDGPVAAPYVAPEGL
jgi:hypothetical protein